MWALGRLFNILPIADDVYIDLKGAAGVTFVGVNAAGDTWTLTEAKDAAGTGAQVLATMTQYYVSATNGAVWQKLTQAAASTIVTTASQDVLVVEIEGVELSALYDWVKLTSTGAGLVYAITHDLAVQRAPQNLPAMV